FAAAGCDGLLRDKTRPSRIPPLGPEVAERVVASTLADPPGETTHWTADMMAKEAGISASAVRHIWKAHGQAPHRWRQFKLSNDPKFVDKLRDVVGLYVDPPAHAIVLSVDEKSQIQALDRTQPGLPMKKGRLGTMTHDYKRNGTTTLFAALNILDGTINIDTAFARSCSSRLSSMQGSKIRFICRPWFGSGLLIGFIVVPPSDSLLATEVCGLGGARDQSVQICQGRQI
uniref:IS630 family transposase n=1 Tax=Elioraea sp. TaxID=2185103 RepID=UPI003F71CA0A